MAGWVRGADARIAGTRYDSTPDRHHRPDRNLPSRSCAPRFDERGLHEGDVVQVGRGAATSRRRSPRQLILPCYFASPAGLVSPAF